MQAPARTSVSKGGQDSWSWLRPDARRDPGNRGAHGCGHLLLVAWACCGTTGCL